MNHLFSVILNPAEVEVWEVTEKNEFSDFLSAIFNIVQIHHPLQNVKLLKIS